MPKESKIDLDRLYDLYVLQGLSGRECASILGVSKSSVSAQTKKNGWSRPKNQHVDEYGRFIKKDQTLPAPDQWGENNPNWNGGKADHTYRRIAFENHPNHCYHCKTIENLEVHHIDRDRGNNTPENLRVVCTHCHRVIEHSDRERDELGRYI